MQQQCQRQAHQSSVGSQAGPRSAVPSVRPVPHPAHLTPSTRRVRVHLSSSSFSDSEDMPGTTGKTLRAINEATKWVVSATVAATVCLRPELPVVWCIFGSLVNVVICKVLKRLIREQRPSTAAKDDHGMPSSHAQSLGYLSVYTSVSLVAYHLAGQYSHLVATGVLALGVFMAWLRISSGYHTTPQVVVGFTLGSGVAAAWQHLGSQFVLPKASGLTVAFIYGATGAAALAFCIKSLLGAKHDLARFKRVLGG